jgi:hypothetical protein
MSGCKPRILEKEGGNHLIPPYTHTQGLEEPFHPSTAIRFLFPETKTTFVVYNLGGYTTRSGIHNFLDATTIAPLFSLSLCHTRSQRNSAFARRNWKKKENKKISWRVKPVNQNKKERKKKSFFFLHFTTPEENESRNRLRGGRIKNTTTDTQKIGS